VNRRLAILISDWRKQVSNVQLSIFQEKFVVNYVALVHTIKVMYFTKYLLEIKILYTLLQLEFTNYLQLG
jgi:hypothetical protein